ncbi:CxxxxCH/CxxCH domain c-type cytochrome [Geomesophilobacter sediminis]|uniref:CxxxxCH/CxxCH domain-containing protein n=1 Tax=Geomesophilobacter sediminis TaxID=2798584 RepID=A0A8J7LXG3_9BACT|nr:CxxxxCH/CxxCH domain-containing protein [Geomesophilobacter sediminis]MBJ6723112.1 CxxxxCH/CxxCH domain-containing protein [Geomesophilobacter sediminis]
MKSYPIPTSRNTMAILARLLLVMAIISGGVAQAASQYTLRCDDCHTMPPLDSANGKRDPQTGAFKGNHQGHSTSTATSCTRCHGAGVTSYGSGHATSKEIKVDGNINNSPAGGTYTRSFVNQTSLPPNPLGSCSNVNCHFEALSQPWGSAPYATAASCADCHGNAPADGSHPALSGSGKKHGDYYGTGAASCVKCHPDHLAEGKPFAHATSAGHRPLALSFTAPVAGGSYSLTANLAYPNYLPSQTAAAARNGNCDNLYCHSDGRGGYRQARWGGTLPADCTGCHGGNASSAAILATGSHSQHVNNANATGNGTNLGSNYACGRCHSATVAVTSDRAVTGLGFHVNNSRDVSFPEGGSYAGGACATVCHSAGKSAAPQPAAPTWGGGAISCKGCHGANGGDGGFVSQFGEPNYANGGVGSPLANSHSASHMVGSAASCQNCHAATTADGVSILNGSTAHTDGAITVAFAPAYDLGGAAYAAADKSCSATYCHSDGNGGAALASAKWGGTMTCRSCHGGDAASAAPIATFRHGAHMNNYSTLGRGNNLLCAECHAKTVGFGDNTTLTNPANHVNRFKDYSGPRAGGSAGYAAGVCSNVYCHSSGQAVPVFRNLTGSKNWKGSAKLDCSGCHGYGPGEFVPVAGEPNYPSAPGAENSHLKHTVGAGMADSRGCAACHRTTVDAGVAGKLRDYSSAHLNGSRDVTFKVIGNYSGHYVSQEKSCANTYCHGAGKSVAWGTPGPLSCTSCHRADATLAGRHGSHWESTSPALSYTATTGNRTGTASAYAFECSSCHAGTHAGGPVAGGNAAEVFFTYTARGLKGSYSYGASTAVDGTLQWSNGSCSTTYCHSKGDGTEGFGSAAMTWASPAKTLRCNGCHGGDASKPNMIDTGLHRNHIDPSSNSSLGAGNGRMCAECHGKTAAFNNNTTLADKRNHINKFKDYTGIYAGGNANYNQATKSCATVYCHSNGKRGTAVSQYRDPAAWNSSATLGCNGCHGQAAAPDFPSDANLGTPNYASGPVGSNTANSHKLHVQKMGITTANACYVCHAKTMDKYALKFRPYSTMHITGGTNIVFGSMQATGFELISSVAKANYAKTTRTCSTVTCHSNGKGGYTDVQWGASTNCALCHPMNKLSRGHSFHVYTGAANTPTVYNNFTANRSNSGVAPGRYNYGCANCHPINNPNHMKGKVLIDLTPGSAASVGTLRAKNGAGITVGGVAAGTAGSGTTVVGNALTCDNVYCHSNGYATNPVYATTPDWYAGSFTGDRCAACHGNWPNATIAGSPTHYNTSWGGTGQPGGHLMGIHPNWIANGANFTGIAAPGTGDMNSHGNGSYSTTIGCNTCHWSTVQSAANGGSAQCAAACHNQSANKASAVIFDRAKHVNGSVEVAFQTGVTVKSKAQLRPSSFATVSSATLWHRNGTYKTAGTSSFDASKQLLAAGSYAGGTCSTVICHFNKPVTWSIPAGSITCQSCHQSM